MSYSALPVILIAIAPLISNMVQQLVQLWIMYNPPQWIMQYSIMMFNAMIMLAMALMIGQVMSAFIRGFTYFRW